MRATEHAPRNPFRVLERRHGLAEIVGRGAGVRVERPRVSQLHPEREFMTLSKNASRLGRHLAQHRLGFFEALQIDKLLLSFHDNAVLLGSAHTEKFDIDDVAYVYVVPHRQRVKLNVTSCVEIKLRTPHAIDVIPATASHRSRSASTLVEGRSGSTT